MADFKVEFSKAAAFPQNVGHRAVYYATNPILAICYDYSGGRFMITNNQKFGFIATYQHRNWMTEQYQIDKTKWYFIEQSREFQYYDGTNWNNACPDSIGLFLKTQ